MEQSLILLVSIVLILAVFSPGKKALNALKKIKLPAAIKIMKASDPWMMGPHELFAHAKFIKWLLLALIKMIIIFWKILIAFFTIAILAATNMMSKTVAGVKKVVKT